MKRKIITINEELCDGCGNCVSACSEGALQIVDGKAKLVKEGFCDGFGDLMNYRYKFIKISYLIQKCFPLDKIV